MQTIKQAVEADLNALKDLLAQTANAQELTDSQVADIKAAQEKTDGERSETVLQDV